MGVEKFVVHFFLALVTLAAVVSSDDRPGCKFVTHKSTSALNGERQIATLKGLRFNLEDTEYKYDIGICTNAIDPTPPDSPEVKEAGVVQFSKKDQSYTVIGKFTHADIVAGPEWVLLEYNGGKPYGSIAHCNQAERRARIMFVCDPNSKDDQPIMLEEQNNKTESCYYLFEIGTSAVCLHVPLITVGLSVGSVLLIVFVCVVCVYLLGGCLYQRFALGAKGLEQIPNQRFWEDCGNLQADGCDLVCRARRSKQPKSYKGIGDDQLQDLEERTDDHLLPM